MFTNFPYFSNWKKTIVSVYVIYSAIDGQCLALHAGIFLVNLSLLVFEKLRFEVKFGSWKLSTFVNFLKFKMTVRELFYWWFLYRTLVSFISYTKIWTNWENEGVRQPAQRRFSRKLCIFKELQSRCYGRSLSIIVTVNILNNRTTLQAMLSSGCRVLNCISCEIVCVGHMQKQSNGCIHVQTFNVGLPDLFPSPITFPPHPLSQIWIYHWKGYEIVLISI